MPPQGNLRQEVHRLTVRYKGSLLLPTDTDVNTETLVTYVLFSKHPNLTFPAFKEFHSYFPSPALINLDITSDIVDWVPKTIKGASGT